MLLAIDIGNTDFTIGVFQGKKLCDTFRMRTKINRTSDEYGVFILNTLQYKGYDTKDVEDVIIASVVPAVMHSFNSAIIKYFGLTPIVVGPGIRTGIRIATTNPKETGADRIVDAVAGYELYGGPVIVVDFGTATTPLCTFHLSKTCPTDLLYFAAIPFNISSSNGLYLPPPSGAHASGITS